MQTIFLSIPHQICSSDLLRTKYISYLASKYKVVVFSPFIDEQFAEKNNYFRPPNVTYIKWEMENSKLWSWMKLFRISCIRQFDHLTTIVHHYKRDIFQKNRRRKLLHWLSWPFQKILTAGFFESLEFALIKNSVVFKNHLEKYQPALLVSGTPGFSEFEAELILLARKNNLKTVAMNFTWDNLTANAKHIRRTDRLICWNSIMKDEAMKIHKYSPEKIFVSGTPRFDPYFDKNSQDSGREKFLKSKGLNPKYKTIFHTTVTKAYPFQKKYIHDLINLRQSGAIPYVNIFIRIHPLDLPENYKEFSGVSDFYLEKAGQEAAGKVEMSYEDLLNLKHSLQYTDLNINYASTISIEACIFDKPIINIGYLGIYALAYDFNHYKPIYESGAVRLVKEDADLPKLINLYLENPSLDRENRKKIVDSYVEFTDGLSYKRSADLLEKCLV